MARWKFPQDRTVFVHTGPLKPILEPSHHAVVLYEDPECTRLAACSYLDGSTVAHSTVYTDADGLLPEFFGPSDYTTLYAKPHGVPRGYPVEAQYGPRIDSIVENQNFSYHHTQNTVSTVWEVHHDLGYRPGGITVFDSSGTMVEGIVEHVSADVFTITFTEAISGQVDVS